MPMVDVYARESTFADKHQLAVDLATTVMVEAWRGSQPAICKQRWQGEQNILGRQAASAVDLWVSASRRGSRATIQICIELFTRGASSDRQALAASPPPKCFALLPARHPTRSHHLDRRT